MAASCRAAPPPPRPRPPHGWEGASDGSRAKPAIRRPSVVTLTQRHPLSSRCLSPGSSQLLALAFPLRWIPARVQDAPVGPSESAPWHKGVSAVGAKARVPGCVSANSTAVGAAIPLAAQPKLRKNSGSGCGRAGGSALKVQLVFSPRIANHWWMKMLALQSSARQSGRNWLGIVVAGVLGFAACAPAVAEDVIEVVPQLGHSSSIAVMAFSPDGRLLVSGSFDVPPNFGTPRRAGCYEH